MKKALIPFLLVFLFSSTPMKAQFYVGGEDDGHLEWKQMSSEHYRVIYPCGLDSLAKVFASSLEKYHSPLSETIGFQPNQSYRKKMPVVLHNGMAVQNGSVAWSPRRMDIYTVPDAFSPEAMTWNSSLSVHEGRHVAQMQYVNHGKFKFLGKITGELGAGALAAVYAGPAFFEGDAVNTETSLLFGRGKTADFLEYYKVAFSSGDMRNVYQWRYGSQKKYTPDYYRAGYLFFAGMEEFYDVPDFAKRYYAKLFEPKKLLFPFAVLNKTVKDISGKNFRQTFDTLALGFKEKWAVETLKRGPFMPSSQVSETPSRHTEYRNLFFADSLMFCTKAGIAECTTFNGRPFSPSTSFLRYSASAGKVFWSEVIPDRRWSLKQKSVIRAMAPSDGKIMDITSDGRLYNPAPSPDGTLLSVTDYPYEGGSSLYVITVPDGKILKTFRAPDGMQIVESVWCNGEIYISGITDEGLGIYCASGDFRTVLPASQAKINQLWSEDGVICFTSDRTSVNELYGLDPESGTLFQFTDTEFGASDFSLFDGYLYYSSLTPEGRLVFRTPAEDLPVKKVSFEDYYSGSSPASPKDTACNTTVETYSKLKNLIHFHSFVPLYVNYDELADMSFDSFFSKAGLGATGFFQNELGTMYGSVGLGLYPQAGGFAKLTYTGLYPVINVEYNNVANVNSVKLKSYVPLNFSSGGWSRGVIPQITASWNETKGFSAGVTIRGYTMRPVAGSQIYPRLGIGAELGVIAGDNRFYGYLYGYLPGVVPQHGLKLSALVQKWDPVEKHPAGRFTADYAMPVLPLDWAGMSPVAYLRNFELILHGDCDTNGLFHVGSDIVLRMENLIWIPYTTRIGAGIYYGNKGVTANLILGIDL